MNWNFLRYLVIPVLVFMVAMVVGRVRDKVYKPNYDDSIQTPGKLQGCLLKFLVVLDGILFIFALLGLIAGEMEMALVFGGLALIFLVCILIIRREYNTSYEEHADYFILNKGKKSYQVYYEDIIDWQPAYNEIAILDQTRVDNKYIKVNLKLFKPEILLRKIADMAFAGKFDTPESLLPEEQDRRAETIHYLVFYQFGYLVEDYVEQIERANF